MPNTVSRLYKRASIIPKSLNSEDRSVSLSWSQGTRGLREGWGFRYYEELSMKKGDIRLDRASRGIPLQDDHYVSNEHNIGRVFDVQVGKTADGVPEGVGRAIFDTHELAQRRYNSVSNGILTDFSVGYRVYEYRKVEEVTESDGSVVPVYRATDWEPMEISLVPVGFDATSSVRSEDSEQCFTPRFLDGDLQTRDAPEIQPPAPIVEEIPDEPVTERNSPMTVSEPVIDLVAERDSAAQAERLRARSIREICQRAGSESDAFEHIDSGVSVEQVREIMFDKLAARQVKPVANAQVQVVRDEVDTRKEGMTSALLHRVNGARYQLDDNSRRFHGQSLADFARGILNNPSMSNSQAVTRVLQTTSEFTNILANVASKSLMDAFEQAPRSFEPWVKRGLVNDFKAAKRVRLGDMDGLEYMPEHSEFKNATMSDRGETIQAKTYGRKFGLTREAIINDDLDAFSQLPTMIANKAANLESDLVYAALIAGTTATMSDGNELFSSAHGNIGSSGVISVTTLDDMIKLFRKQITESGDLINVMPQYIIVPAELEGTARAFMQTITPATASNVNIHVGAYQIVVEPRLSVLTGGSATRWYMAANPAMVPSIELVNLRGQEGLQLDQLDSEQTLGIWWRAYYDVGVAAIEWRGIGTNAGT